MTDDRSETGVALVGCGTVGGGVATLLIRDSEILGGRIASRLALKYVVDQDLRHARGLGIDESLLSESLDDALADDSVQVIVELIGGTTAARTITERALCAGKHVVTANKALLAYHGAELLAIARQNGVTIGFEASCAGGIPIVRALTDGLIANRIDAIYGIVNGTCNYILTSMTGEGKPYAQALSEAQAGGLAEADPTLDVSGGDSAHKLAILAGLAFGRKIDFEAIPVWGIDDLELRDVAYAAELGYVVKLLAIAHRRQDGLSLRVRPAFISRDHPLAWVSGPFNAVSVYGHATGHTMYYGRGAGAMPTASAVVADIAAVATGSAASMFSGLALWPDLCERANQLPASAIESRYYLRLSVKDRPGVLGRVAAILGRHDISIYSVLQHQPPDEASGVPVVITTYQAFEGELLTALKQIDELDDSVAPTTWIAIVDEHPEKI